MDAKKDFEWLDNTMYEIADYIIAHNANMISYLIEKGVSRNKIINLKIFDYLTDLNIQKKEIKRGMMEGGSFHAKLPAFFIPVWAIIWIM